jgi:hypothetical protein
MPVSASGDQRFDDGLSHKTGRLGMLPKPE